MTGYLLLRTLSNGTRACHAGCGLPNSTKQHIRKWMGPAYIMPCIFLTMHNYRQKASNRVPQKQVSRPKCKISYKSTADIRAVISWQARMNYSVYKKDRFTTKMTANHQRCQMASSKLACYKYISKAASSSPNGWLPPKWTGPWCTSRWCTSVLCGEHLLTIWSSCMSNQCTVRCTSQLSRQ